MDLSASPDFDAFYCYVIVFMLGLVTAVMQINKRLLNYPGKWVTWHTWTLLGAYTFLPVILFWLLDRVHAISDTSLFAAVLIGAGYQQVLSGNLATIRAGEISRIWQPFTTWSDYIADRIRDRIITNSERFDERLRSEVLSDPKKQDDLKFLAMTHEKDPAALQEKLDKFTGEKEVLGEKGVQLKLIAALYDSLKISSPRNFEYLLHRSGVTSAYAYHWYTRQWRSKVTALVAAAAAVILMLQGARFLKSPSTMGQYYAWRLKKENATDSDRERARRKLLAYSALDPGPMLDLISSLRYSAVTPRVADNIFTMVLESRTSLSERSLAGALIDSLRTDNAAIRTRTNDTLLYLANEKGVSIPAELKNWKPNQKETLNDIDTQVGKWKHVDWSAKDKPGGPVRGAVTLH
jgi:hypothetical protein